MDEGRCRSYPRQSPHYDSERRTTSWLLLVLKVAPACACILLFTEAFNGRVESVIRYSLLKEMDGLTYDDLEFIIYASVRQLAIHTRVVYLPRNRLSE